MTVDRAAGPRCNIGPDEIARRRRSAVAASIATVTVAVALVALHVPGPARLLIWPLAAATSVTWLQVTRRFCVAFGALGLQNFGRLGEESRVDSPLRAADRRLAFRIILEGALIGLVAALALAAIPA